MLTQKVQPSSRIITHVGRWYLAIVLFLLLVALFLLSVVRNQNLNHDEHQFVVSGILLAEEGLLPYRDYPYFHLPNLVFLYGFLFRFSDYPFLIARLFSTLCEWLLVLTLFFVAWFRLVNFSLPKRFLISASIVLFLITNTLFLYTSGIAWNHAPPVLLTMWTFLIYAYALPKACPSVYRKSRFVSEPSWLFLSGLLMGTAIGIRLSFATLILPFLLIIFLNQHNKGHSLRPIFYKSLLFMAGVGIALLPSLWAFWLTPEEFIFGNLGYARLNMLYREAMNWRGMTLSGKFLYFIDDLLFFKGEANFVFFATFLLLVGSHLRPPSVPPNSGRDAHLSCPAGAPTRPQSILWLLLPFLLLGALAPTPAQLQYFYPLMPVCLLLILYALPISNREPQWKLYVFGGALIISLLTGNTQRYINLLKLSNWHNATPFEWHRMGEKMTRLTEGQKVLTLAPIVPLEGGSQIYESFATGPFAWRVASLLPPEERQAQGMISPQELPTLLAAQPPRAILLGVEPEDIEEEAPLLEYANSHPFALFNLPDGMTLWLSALAEWEEMIRLAAYELPREPLMPGDSLQALFHLQSLASIERNLHVLVRLVDNDGHELLRDEGWPYGRPTSKWKKHDIWHDGHDLTIPVDAAEGYYQLWLSFYDPATLKPLSAVNPHTGDSLGEALLVDYLYIGQLPAPPAGMSPIDLGDQIRLLGATISGMECRGFCRPLRPKDANQPLEVTLFWQRDNKTPITPDLTVFVHLVGPDGQLVAQQDQPPPVPTYLWRMDDIIVDQATLTLPADAPAGSYELRVGMYDPATGQRLPVSENEEIIGDYVIVARFQVK